MNLIIYLADTLKYAFLILITWFLIRPYLNSMLDSKRLILKTERLKTILPLRLQAYERVVLFLERINPTSMLVRVHVAGMTAIEKQQQILAEIRAEFQHNVAQQLYLSNHSWEVVKKIMEDTVAIVNNTVSSLPEDASALVLSKTILHHLESLEMENPYEAALKIIKRDIQQLF